MPPHLSSGSVRLFSIDRLELLSRLREAVVRLRAECPEVDEVRLFGSLARGDQTGLSDVDILIVLHDTCQPDPVLRTRAYLPYFDLDRGVDIIPSRAQS